MDGKEFGMRREVRSAYKIMKPKQKREITEPNGRWVDNIHLALTEEEDRLDSSGFGYRKGKGCRKDITEGSGVCYLNPKIRSNKYQDADKSLARPARKQAWKHVRDARDFNKIETRAVIKCLFLQGKAPKEIRAILTETLACFLPGRTKDLSTPPQNSIILIQQLSSQID